jgi:formate dehydrogenase subunit delta
MHIDLLISMANQISDFFHGASPESAPRDVANHLKRYWDPRMRTQIIQYYEERHGSGLSDIALGAIAQLKAEKAPPAAARAAGADGDPGS